jgi:hypothetical protein
LHRGGDELLAGTPPNFITTSIPADSEKFMNKNTCKVSMEKTNKIVYTSLTTSAAMH